jgi:hypothetical protein
MAHLAGRPVAEPGGGSGRLELSDADADHVCELRAGAVERPGAARGGAGGHDGARPRRAGARPAVALPGRVRLPRVRTDGGAARARSLHPLPLRSPHRQRVRIRGLAVSALPLRPAVHARQLRHRPAGAGGGAVGVQGGGGPIEPRGGGVDRPGRQQARAQWPLGGGVRGPEPGAARAGGGGGPQRHPGDRAVGARPGTDGRGRGNGWGERGGRSSTGGGMRAGGGCRREADGGARAPVSRALLAAVAGAAGHVEERVAGPASAGGGGRDRLRGARPRFPGRRG